ncbi:unnamed protein product [Cyclocybe aegerita]|uniref:F-box domain-containing protein n=1 Tax=Cyclocybe aegerita TaxID=1973307 RepID=A0A8S0WAR6_CYCAE|nr:unnamed protein product [Cyclocybe aegerita]
MTTEVGRSHIHKLHDDLLWCIFALNADMTEDPYNSRSEPLSQWKPRAITNIRNTSHVCRTWRQLVLSSPSLWGRLIDFKYLTQLPENWRNEIMDRTGDAPLAIVAEVYEDDTAHFGFFVDLLRTQWSRIESLEVYLHCDNLHTAKGVLSPIYQVSKSLRFFHLSLSLPDDEYIRPSKINLFDNDAPRLSYFSCSFGLESYFNAPWLSQLRHLEVRSPYDESINPSFLQWLEKLRSLPQLETIEFSGGISHSYEGWESIPAVGLPLLRYIKIHDRLFPAALLLDRIDCPSTCGVKITTTDYDPPTTPFEVSFIHRVIAKYAEQWTTHMRHRTQLTFSMMYKAFMANQHPPNYLTPAWLVPVFHADIYCAACAQLPLILPYLEAFSNCDFTHITTLSLFTNLFEGMEFDKNVEKFLYSLPNIEVMDTPMESLERLMNLPGILDGTCEGPVFPKLRKVILDDERVLDPSGKVDRGARVGAAFFLWRIDEGIPICVVDITGCHKRKEMTYLEDVAGLEVIWTGKDGNINGYVCGSGSWDELDFGQGVRE